MDQFALVALDLVAITLLSVGVYFPRHRRRDLVVAFLGVNVGVLAASLVLGSSGVGAGLGLGLFGVLSIIRLRSREIEQHEVAYYFAALALGLIAGLSPAFGWLPAGLMALVVLVLVVADHPGLFRRSRQQLLTLDRAIADEDELRDAVAALLGARIHSVKTEQLDFVNDTTIVDVRFEAPRPGTRKTARADAVAAPAAAGAPASIAPASTTPASDVAASDAATTSGTPAPR
ncbi:DUF4956 domain-containing protein [Agromyces archimandritae]|uniref:DUF4956 domain-containing protein n=1 Tax=Agromyces archimandritae TaxID=2781962 RepID=A0A975FPL1_9MICO|nr:DUF4956 domain-containing protein [Agromyces archimandritae]QTX05697.1 DUF4956 domain-containing protein [Agromyces archimandritae]